MPYICGELEPGFSEHNARVSQEEEQQKSLTMRADSEKAFQKLNTCSHLLYAALEKLCQSGTKNLKKPRLVKPDGINMGACAYHHQLASFNTVA